MKQTVDPLQREGPWLGLSVRCAGRTRKDVGRSHGLLTIGAALWKP